MWTLLSWCSFKTFRCFHHFLRNSNFGLEGSRNVRTRCLCQGYILFYMDIALVKQLANTNTKKITFVPWMLMPMTSAWEFISQNSPTSHWVVICCPVPYEQQSKSDQWVLTVFSCSICTALELYEHDSSRCIDGIIKVEAWQGPTRNIILAQHFVVCIHVNALCIPQTKTIQIQNLENIIWIPLSRRQFKLEGAIININV